MRQVVTSVYQTKPVSLSYYLVNFAGSNIVKDAYHLRPICGSDILTVAANRASAATALDVHWA